MGLLGRRLLSHTIVNLLFTGTTFIPLSLAADVVGHELTHGVTQYSSSLIYQDEAGALNEAISDIFGACVDRQEGASITNTWLIGEAIYTPGTPNDALRYMTNPTKTPGNTDFYPERFQGTYDNGGVHLNSGIANLAFTLMVQGGSHPRGKTSIIVQPIDADFDTSLMAAAKIFYLANTACLTPMASFASMRQCTALHAGPYTPNVEAAWDAVGVTSASLASDVPVTGLSAYQGQYTNFAVTNIRPGSTVSCSTQGVNGDADLYLDMKGQSTSRHCASEGSNSYEVCSIGPLKEISNVYVTIYAYVAYSDLKLTCSIHAAPPTRAPTKRPTRVPTKRPTRAPTKRPTKRPTRAPTKRPTRAPTKAPTKAPTSTPSKMPSSVPSPPTILQSFNIKNCFRDAFLSGCSCLHQTRCFIKLSRACQSSSFSAGFSTNSYYNQATRFIKRRCP
jgi:hypothetical protein